ncbi:MAG: hypothetical protein ABI402_08955 [Ferruginibacter sp.]
MKMVLVYILIFLIGFIAYTMLTFFIISKKKSRIKEQNLDAYKSAFGTYYQYRKLENGLFRYKWPKGWLILRASFDANGNLIECKLKPRQIFSFLDKRFLQLS